MMIRSSALLATILALASANQAFAGDAAAKPAYDWSGVYAGLDLGGALNNSTWGPDTSFFPSFNVDGAGLIAGGHVGYRQQQGSFVFGVEGRAAASTLSATALCLGTNPTCVNTQDYLASLEGNLGLANGPLLVYATGGVAFTTYHASQRDALVQHWNRDDRIGWTAGLGLDYAIDRNWTAGIQWNYYDFGSAVAAGGLGPATVKFRDTENVLNLRINYRF